MKAQDWGLPPWKPAQLTALAYAPFIATLRANMRHAGALRIDHVMVLARLFCLPHNGADGAYVEYPIDDLAAIVALESRRAHCVIVGEDLGTVAPSIRQMMQQRGMLSYRPLYFERDAGGGFRPPWRMPRNAVVTLGTHDLPTWSGFWSEADIDTREALRFFTSAEVAARSRSDRARDRLGVLKALAAAGFDVDERNAPAIENVYAYIARSPAALLTFQMEDVFGQVDQINLPGTTEVTYPNWRRKLPVALEDWADAQTFRRITAALRRERGAAPGTAADRAAVPDIPSATYRLQLRAGFGFDQAAAVLPYLKALGISHVYLSPIMQARPGSTHGYDVTDYGRLNPELGGAAAFERYCAALKVCGLRQVVDIVPNHMGVLDAPNRWWRDILTHGQASRYARHFDINWQSPNPLNNGKVLLAVLGSQYGTTVARGELKLEFEPASGAFEVTYFAHQLPIDPRESPQVLTLALKRLQGQQRASLEAVIGQLSELPARDAPLEPGERARAADDAVAKLAVAASSATVADAINAAVADINHEHGFGRLHELLDAQPYRLAHWRVAADEINYRRFFDINDLAGVRSELPEVFEDVHRELFRLIHRGYVHGLRIDHPDGLRDPGMYFEELQARAGASHAGARPLFVVVEKILAEDEHMPDEWPVHGETGYQFANVVNGLFVDSAAAERFSRIYSEFTGEHASYDSMLFSAKKLVLSEMLSSEFAQLAGLLQLVAQSSPATRDFTLNILRSALASVIAAFPVYRTYIVAGHVSDQDRRYVKQAVKRAREASRQIDPSVFEFIHDVLLHDDSPHAAAFVARFQQVTAPVMAKAMEDTCFYRYNRLISLNEVGGYPGTFGISVARFHKAMAERACQWPYALSATSTHDTKRGENVRARINILSEMPRQWRLLIRRFARLNARHKSMLDGIQAPSSNDEYLLYQTLIGVGRAASRDFQAMPRTSSGNASGATC